MALFKFLLAGLAFAFCAGAAFPQTPDDASAADTPQPSYTLTLPLVFQEQILGDVIVHIQQNGDARFDRASLLDRLLPLIAPDSQEAFSRSLTAGPLISPVQLNREGIQLRYDPEGLQVLVEAIDPSIGAVRTIGPAARYVDVPVTQEPKDFSAYLNTVGEMRYDQTSDRVSPLADFFAAVRLGGVVFELDAGYDELLTEDGFYRRAARIVYDQPEQQRRFTAGDVRQDNLSLLGSVFLGGVSIEKGRRVFDQYRPVYSTGGQQVTIDRRTVVDVVSNGNVIDTIELAPGNYDLSQLPLRYGANNIDLVATDGSGRQLFSSVDLFIDPYDLGRGEVEYKAAVGYTSDNIAFNPEYGEDLSFSGTYRRGVTNRVVLGGGLQLSEAQQVVALESRFTPRNLPGRIEFAAAGSAGDSQGAALSTGYFATFRDQDRYSQISLSGYYESEGFATLGESSLLSTLESLTLNGSYSRSLRDDTSLLAGTSWIQRQGLADERSFFVDIVREFTNGVRAVAGVEYGTGGIYEEDFGIRLGLSTRFGPEHSFRSNYNSRRDQLNASFSKGYDDKVGEYGYEAGLRRSEDSVSADLRTDYIGNRFEGRAAYISSGSDFGSIGDNNTAFVQLGTSIAYAGGEVAVGRPISDSFVIAEPHESLSDEQVILGDQLRDNKYEAESGWFGPALGSRLYSYNRQDVAYDLKDAPAGTDIGTGIETLNPPYRSGYVLKVGTDANVSAVGTLIISDQPGALIVGRVEAANDPDFEPVAFFTNSVGRFAIIGLRPGRTYRVRLNDYDVDFEIEVPDNGTKLVRLGQVTLATGG